MPTLILARHGRTTANTGGVLAGRSKGVHLDDHGVEQARSAGRRLVGVPLTAVVSSPLERCRESAKEMLREHPSPPKVSTDRGLLECDYGSWAGQPLSRLAKEPLWKTVQAHPSAAVFPDGESLAEMSARSVGAVRRWDQRVADEHGPDAVWLAVSHGDIIKAVIADALGIHLDAFQRIVVDPASLSVIRYTPLRPFVVSTNTTAGDLAHLRPSTRRRRGRKQVSSDAVVGGGVGGGVGGSAAGSAGGTA